jgi:hypothetical protein
VAPGVEVGTSPESTRLLDRGPGVRITNNTATGGSGGADVYMSTLRGTAVLPLQPSALPQQPQKALSADALWPAMVTQPARILAIFSYASNDAAFAVLAGPAGKLPRLEAALVDTLGRPVAADASVCLRMELSVEAVDGSTATLLGLRR